MSTKTASARPDAVRVTVEADNDDDENSEEVEDIGSAASTSSASETELQPEEQRNAVAATKKKRKSEAGGAAGLANVIRGLLAKPLPSAAATAAGGCPILAKALTDRQRFAPSPGGGVAGDDAAKADDNDDFDGLSGQARRRLTAERQRWLCAGRVKPTPEGRDAERELERTACRGVVQLFNAVRTQQRALEARLAGKSEAGRQRVLGSLSKADFLDMLAGRKKKAAEESSRKKRPGENDSADEDGESGGNDKQGVKKKQKKSWGVLSDDYLVKPTLTMKDWDRASSSGGEGEEAGEDEVGAGQQPMDEDEAGSD